MLYHYMISLIHHKLLVGLKNHYVVSQYDPILIMCLRSHFVVSILICLRNHCVISQFDPKLSIRLRNHYVVSQKTYGSQDLKNFVFRIICWRWQWEKLNGSFNFSTANFFPIKNLYKIIRKVCSPY